MTYMFGTIGGGFGPAALRSALAAASLQDGLLSSEFCTAGAPISHGICHFPRIPIQYEWDRYYLVGFVSLGVILYLAH